MIRANQFHITEELLTTAYSTTLYLETMKRKKLNVKVVSQDETDAVIRRVSKLYFSDPDTPLLYCVSLLRIKLLLPEEYRLVKLQEMPLGTVFSGIHHPSVIFKKNLQVIISEFPVEVKEMKLEKGPLYSKSYSFLIGVREVATINEFFNEESLHRL
jgi:chorismate-pyruvate lyase